MIMSKKTLDQAAGKFYFSGPNIDESMLLENQIKKANEEKQQKELSEILIEAEKKKQEELQSKLDVLEIMPMGAKILILPYPRNPYRKIISEGGIILDYDGTFKNPDSGEIDKLEVGIGCAKVIEVGPDTKYIKPGDDIIYDTRQAGPVPFMSLGYKIYPEANVYCVINEKLKERWNQK